jgi:ATP-dependent helicase HrpB
MARESEQSGGRARSDRSGSPLAEHVRKALGSLVIGEEALRFANRLSQAQSAIVTAEPGAGKTTGIPLALLAQDWLNDREASGIVLVEPRRVAASQAAHRMAALLGQQVSSRDAGVVGLRMRGESKIGSQTRIEVVTDGVLARMLSSDPGFSGRSVVIFDEFHERSLDNDVGFALALSARALLRPDLIVVVMSATLEHARVEGLLRDGNDSAVERLTTPGRAFPVTRSHSVVGQDLVGRVEHAVVEAINQRSGDVLVFLPGIHEINQCARRLRQHRALQNSMVLALHARGDAAENAAALRPAQPGQQRIVLSTSLAQTSVTIDGVTTVIDAGLVRRSRRDPDTGLTRLITQRVSLATATQRAGRAGRTAPGHAVALWSPAEHAALAESDPPEITDADLSGPLLTALRWGVHPTELRWVDPPSSDAWERAEAELFALGAVDHDHHLTNLGRQIAELGMHPRIGALLCAARSGEESNVHDVVVDLAAYLSEADWYGTDAPIDLRVRLDELRGSDDRASTGARPFGLTSSPLDRASTGARPFGLTSSPLDRASSLQPGARQRFSRARSQFLKALHAHETRGALIDTSAPSIGALTLQTFPERLASRVADLVDHTTQSGGDRFTFATGLTLPLASGDSASVRGAPLLVAVDVEGDRRRGAIRCGVPVTQAEVQHWVATSTFFRLISRTRSTWIGDRLAAVCESVVTSSIGDVTIGFEPAILQRQDVADAVTQRAATESFPPSDAARELHARLLLAAQHYPDQFQVPDHDWIVGVVSDWLLATTQDSVASFSWSVIDLDKALRHRMNYLGCDYHLNQAAPRTFSLEHDRTHTIRYATDSGRPTIQVRLQDMFGTTTTPSVCGGREPITLELLSPANRVLAVTNDLERFWKVGYPGVRSELRGRYPKHQWPEDPATALPRRMNNPQPRS